jgi:hypothetical protein
MVSPTTKRGFGMRIRISNLVSISAGQPGTILELHEYAIE